MDVLARFAWFVGAVGWSGSRERQKQLHKLYVDSSQSTDLLLLLRLLLCILRWCASNNENVNRAAGMTWTKSPNTNIPFPHTLFSAPLPQPAMTLVAVLTTAAAVSAASLNYFVDAHQQVCCRLKLHFI